MSAKKKNDKKQFKHTGAFKRALELMALGEEANKAFFEKCQKFADETFGELARKMYREVHGKRPRKKPKVVTHQRHTRSGSKSKPTETKRKRLTP
jgi:hypothetical protein